MESPDQKKPAEAGLPENGSGEGVKPEEGVGSSETVKPAGERAAGERARRARPADERAGRPARPAGERAGRPARPAGERAGRPARPAGERAGRPARPAGERAGRPARPADERAGRPARPADERAGRPARPADERAGRPARPADERARRAARPAGERPAGAARPSGKPSGKRAMGEGRPAGTRPSGERTAGAARPAGARPSGRPTGARPVRSSGRRPADQQVKLRKTEEESKSIGISGVIQALKAKNPVKAKKEPKVKDIKAENPSGNSSEKKTREPEQKRPLWMVLLSILLVLLLITGCIYAIPVRAYQKMHDGMHSKTAALSQHFSSSESKSKDQKNTGTAEDTEAAAKKEKQKALKFKPHAVESTEPDKFITKTEVQQDGKTLENISDYKADGKISFGQGNEYTEVEGILTFRGNNFRDSPSYGTANLEKKKFKESWVAQTSALRAPDGYVWTGNGWTGQPLIVTWSKKMRQNMNMEDWAKDADELTEVIYASLDGKIYFLELETGKATRDPMDLGYTFKGAGALDPRGYPIMYVGSGYNSGKGVSHAFIINLLDCSVMHEFGMQDSFSLRGNLSFFDSSALVSAETDQLIYPGENGILYIMKLNSNYNAKKGTVSIDPDEPVKWRYKGTRNASWYIGMEDSAITWKNYIFFSTNDGYMFCLNLNTLETVWVQDVLDDTNCTPILELEDGHPYIYQSTSFHLGWRSSTSAEIPIWKIDAETGEIVWSTSYDCRSVKGNSGGVQGTIAVGKNKLKNLIFVPVAKTPTVGAGKIVALDKKSGKEVWVLEDKSYAWSSPVAIYDKKGNGYVITCDSAGDTYLLDGLTGEVLDKINLGSNVEASPAVFNNMMVVGTRGQKIYGITLE